MKRRNKNYEIKLVLISRSWPPEENSGVSLAAREHLNILMDLGYNISIVSSNPSVISLDAPIRKYYVKSEGSGALYSRIKFRSQDLTDIFNRERPDLIILESWQTAITEGSLRIAFSLKIPILMISHGISVFPFSNSLVDIFRSISWIPYFLNFRKKLTKLTATTTLSEFSDSVRFFDRKLANIIGLPVFYLTNHPINFNSKIIDFNCRKKQILVVGYFSRVKNQLAAISAIQFLPEPLKLIFVGEKNGAYYQKCLQEVKRQKISHRVIFYDDQEINLRQAISESLIVYMPSITEVMPITLLEAMASGTPFITSNIGAIKDFNAGILENNLCNHAVIMNKLIEDSELWSKISKAGLVAYKSMFTRRHTKQLLDIAVTRTIKYAYLKDET